MKVGTLSSSVIIAMVFIIGGSSRSFSQDVAVTNVSFALRGSDVVIHYDLAGPTDSPYEVKVVLKRESQPFFKMAPKDISGDIGTGSFTGRNKEIVWHMYQDVPYGFDGADFYFEVNATLLGNVKGGGSAWGWIIGTAVVGGAAAAYFGTDLFKKPGGAGSFPVPPSRP